ncbi:hypothetical protein FWK35_00009491, partial [Aphis craccivora]
IKKIGIEGSPSIAFYSVYYFSISKVANWSSSISVTIKLPSGNCNTTLRGPPVGFGSPASTICATNC